MGGSSMVDFRIDRALFADFRKQSIRLGINFLMDRDLIFFRSDDRNLDCFLLQFQMLSKAKTFL